ncbi:mitochondrial tRNA-specific 2-thiouridylase 1 [Topomyia yanbarensis]|uniref:mitochondrial tRNA-specific 2-thiouridylase 1 n=1 Tax=Topomyia yanbarensis TaxID=2498891 RepID=UPI00273B7706|nr:mitochondrial tRNA-specific 2-thiouridylase 1 [Topomyia yanbarensis]XP_058835351.1 mitochondrial tRNA-specific 2-thiouridylase 1 [Topomyia yanbarensis]
MFRKIVVGISGGVDSAVTAYLLKNKGYDIHGAFMKNWDLIDESGYCSGEQDWLDAQKLCRQLDIPLQQVNFVKEYWLGVFGSFLADYNTGITPNPDILCNRHIKFNLFFKYAREKMGADAIATGHYAKTNFGPYLENYNDASHVHLLTGVDEIKDQTFFLSQISLDALRYTMFPIGGMTKTAVKRLAADVGLGWFAKKKESMGICFVGKRSFQDFIAEYIESKPGDFVDFNTGKVVGRHKGIHHWTVGQKAKIGGCLRPYYIFQKDVRNNIIYLASGIDNPLLITDMIYLENPVWINKPIELDHDIWRCQFRFQHTKPLVPCSIITTDGRGEKLFVELDVPLTAITPGQYAVFYKDDECFGSARIVKPGPSMIYSQS